MAALAVGSGKRTFSTIHSIVWPSPGSTMVWIDLWKYLQELITLTLIPDQGNEMQLREQMPPSAAAPPKSRAESQTLTLDLCDGNI